MVIVNFLLAFINHFGNLPDWALKKYGFSGGSNFSEWPMRSVVSDYLYFDPDIS